jgi:hypothetical protein
MGPIFTVIAIFSVPAFLLVLSAWVQDLTRFHIWSASFGAGLVAWILKARLNRAHVAFFGTLVSLASLWWAGFMPGLLAWAREGAEYVRVARSGAIYSARETLFRQVLDYGELQLAVLAALGILLLSSSMLGGRARKSPSGTSGCRPLDVLLYPAGATLSLFVALYAGAGSDRRRSLVAITLFSCALFVGAANRFRVAIAAVLCLTAVQYIVIGSAIAGAPRWAAANAFGIPIPHRSPDDNIETAKMLAKHVPQGSVVAVYTLALFSPSDRVYEPNAMRVASLEGEFGFGVGYYWDMAIYDKTISRMQQEGIDYLLLDSFSALPPDASHEPYAHFIKDLLGRVQASSDTPGLQVVAGLHLGNREHFLFRISPLRTQDADSLTVERKGARAIASEEQAGFPVGNINDGTDKAWGSLEGRTDVFAGVVLPVPGAVRAVRLRLMTPNGRAHLRNIRIVTADREKPDAPDWQFVRARLQGERDFVDVITIPPLGDNSTIVIEVDEKDPRWKAHLVWGIACLRSKGDVPNYVPDGTGVYFRELELQ